MNTFLSYNDFYLLRMPVVSVENLLSLNKDLKEKSLEICMKEIFSQPFYQEAIYVASPELFQEFQKWQDGTLTNEKEVSKLAASLYKYYVRMCTRCTPYGLFAGSALGNISEKSTEISVDEFQKYHKHSRLDMNYVAELTEYITNLPIVKSQLKYYLNSSLYKVGNAYRYAQHRLKSKHRSYFLTSINASKYLEKIVQNAQNGILLSELADSLVDRNVNQATAISFVEKLIRSQLLVNELEPTVTGDEFFKVLINRLKSISEAEDIVEKLNIIQELLDKKSDDLFRYKAIKIAIDENFKTTSSKDLVQTDLFFKTTQNNLSDKVAQRLTEQLESLLKLRRKFENANLSSFQKAFSERYEEQEVPLLVALDSEGGIGYGKLQKGRGANLPLVDNVIIDKKETDNKKIQWNAINDLVLKKYEEAISTKSNSVALTQADIDSVTEKDKSETWGLPASSYLFGTLISDNPNALDAGDFKFYMKAFSGPSSGNLLARFCHGDKELTEKVRQVLQQEQEEYPDAILAEVVHLPESRVGNILMRPTLREYEIPYLGHSSVEKDKQIELDDLMVSVQYGKIRLCSKRLNKYVIPRLTTAHNYARGLSIYKFLCDLQFQNINMDIYWNWGMMENKPFLPRVEFENMILSPARWHVQKQLQFPKNANEVLIDSSIKAIVSEQNLPQSCLIAEGDNELLIDFDTSIGRKIFYEKLSQSDVILLEFLSTPNDCFIENDGQKFCNEVIIPINYHKKKTDSVLTQNTETTTQTKGIHVQRTFNVGSEWLYVKLYGGVKSLDKILSDDILPLTNELLEEGIIEKWFFIRYEDTDKHLRIRFYHANKPDFIGIVLSRLHETLKDYLNEGIIFKIQADTYQREIERYGNETMELSESVFFHDSKAIASVLSLIEGDAGEKYRWMFGLRGMDMLLDDFGYDIQTKAKLMADIKEGFFQEFGGSDKLKHQLNDKYRLERESIEKILDAQQDTEEIEPAIDYFKERSAALKLIHLEIKKLQLFNNQIYSHDRLLQSYIHMTMNRLFVTDNRKHELVIYYFLDKYYHSKIARHSKADKEVKINLTEQVLTT
jgi:lantibiotic biosynthesis protein